MRKGVFLISLLICLLIAPSVIMLQSSSLTAYGALQGLSVSTKDVYGPINLQNQMSINPITIPISSGWAITSINMNFSSIVAPNSTISFGEQPLTANNLSIHRATSFQLPENQSAYLFFISLYLFLGTLTDITRNVTIEAAIYNSTDNSGNPYPDTYLQNYTMEFSSVQGNIGWFRYFLDTSLPLGPKFQTTYNNTYFIVARNGTFLLPTLYPPYWFYALNKDSGTGREAYAYCYDETSGNWIREYHGNNVSDTIGYCFRVGLSVNNEPSAWEIPYPTDVNMKVNGTAVVNVSRGVGWCNLADNLNISGNSAILNVGCSWVNPEGVEFNVTIYVYYDNVYLMLLSGSLTALTSMFTFYTSMKDSQDKFFILLGLIALGAVVAVGYGGRAAYKRRMIPLNALKSMENILVDHNPTGTMIWSFDFISMQQDIALVSGFMSAIKSFLEEMKVGGLKRLSTEFGTFIREESQLLTATCITSDIGLDEELWIRSKLHEFLIKIEQSHFKQLEDWKGDVSQFKEPFPAILASLIPLGKVQHLQRQKIENLTRNKDKLQETVNKYGAKLENLKSRYDSGEIDFKKYIVERYKTEAKYDKVQKDYLYASLFLTRAPALLEAKPVKSKDLEKIENIQNRFLEVRREIEELRKKELEGTITSNDIELKENLQKELMTLMEKLDKLKKT